MNIPTVGFLKEYLAKPYDAGNWQNIYAYIFKSVRLFSCPQAIVLDSNNNVEHFFQIGYVDCASGERLLLFDVLVNSSVNMRRNRVMLNNIIAKWVNAGADSAAIGIFHKENGSSYRFTFVRKNAMFDECGVLKNSQTSAKRYTYVLGEGKHCGTAISRFEKLHSISAISLDDIEDAFSVEALTKQFYQELFAWYQWSLSDEVGITFPNDTRTVADDRNIEEHLIRLITRLMFVWFIKQKGLIPECLFNIDKLKELLKGFDPCSISDGNYYNGVLQNLFFATLNNEIENRGFATDKRYKGVAEDYGIKTLYRNPQNDSWFTISDADVVKLFEKVPFLNGGLFECLDKDTPNSNGKIIYSDGFSRKAGRQCRAFIPNVLFFGENGIIPLLSRYNFTIEENSSVDAEVALDPELLGKVFENLLGAYNPETRETVRNQSGSFYTPREIVGYMVDESLRAYLKGMTTSENLDALFSSDELPQSFSEDKGLRQKLATKLKNVKILDPACGSGAFPMGVLNRMVSLLQKLNTEHESIHSQKLHLIENCIYGVDIQTIAVQISKLRFFISLVCEEQPTTDITSNYGISPLPNLETKFVAANTLIAKKSQDMQPGLFEDREIQKTKDRLHEIRHLHFSAKNISDKKKYRREDKENREKLAKILQENAMFAPEDAKQLSDWNPYDQNISASFFDPEWMFGETSGFNIVIGNPPYIQLQKDHGKLAELYKNCNFDTFAKTGDIYCLFYERGYQLLQNAGILCFITSNKWMRAGYGEAIRKFLSEHTNPVVLIDFAGQKIFESATVDTNILIFEKNIKNAGKTSACIAKAGCRDNLSGFVRQNSSASVFASGDSWVILNPIEQSIKRKIEAIGTPLKDWNVQINYGIKTGYNEAFIVSGEKREEILANCKDAEERKRTDELIRPILRGRDIKRYGYDFANIYIIASHNGIPARGIPRIHIENYPAVKRHLDTFWDQISKRSDMGDTPYNLRSCAYMDDFNKQKIIWGEISDKTKFALDAHGVFCAEATTFLMTGERLAFLTCFLNSLLSEYLFSKIGTTTGVGTIRWKKFKIEQLYVPKITDRIETEFSEIINTVTTGSICDIVNRKIYELCALSDEEISFIQDVMNE